MPRFVILRHEMPAGHNRGTHFDLMLESGSVLRTWSVPEFPAVGKDIPAESLPDHRLSYLEYEGPVSGGRGSVRRVEEGEYQVLADSGGLVNLLLAGTTLRGNLTLRRADDVSSLWLASFQPS